MTEKDVNNLINKNATSSQYNVAPTSIHFHNGTDAPKLPVSSLQTSIALNGQPGGIANPVVLNERQFNGTNTASPNPGTIYTLPVPVLYGGGAGTNAEFPSLSKASPGTLVFFDSITDNSINADTGLWLYDLNGWYQMSANSGTPTMKYTNGATARAGNATGGTQVIAHGLGVVPMKTRITINQLWANSTDSTSQSVGVYNGTTTTCDYINRYEGGGAPNCGVISTDIAVIYNAAVGSPLQTATIAVDSTNITLTWARTGTGTDSSPMQIMWEAEALST